MLGYYPPEPPPPGNKRLKLLVQNLENIVELLKEELITPEVTNLVDVSKLMETIQAEEEPDYYEEED
jgi:hypothetical protein